MYDVSGENLGDSYNVKNVGWRFSALAHFVCLFFLLGDRVFSSIEQRCVLWNREALCLHYFYLFK